MRVLILNVHRQAIVVGPHLKLQKKTRSQAEPESQKELFDVSANLGSPGLDSGFMGPPGLVSGLLVVFGLDPGLLEPPMLDSSLLGRPRLDSGLQGPSGLDSGLQAPLGSSSLKCPPHKLTKI